MAADPVAVLLFLADVFERLGVVYFVGGSFASSAYGIPRTSQDVDLVAALRAEHIEPFVAALAGRFYAEEEAVRDAVRRRACFNVIDLASLVKADVFVIELAAAGAAEAARRRRVPVSSAPERFVFMASPEDTVLNKLRWPRLGGGVAEHQWNDLVGVLKVQGRA